MSLSKLREAVEAGLATGGPADALIVPKEQSDLIASVLGDDDEIWSDFVEAHDGSLDAAKRLHDALLPGWDWSMHGNGQAALWPPGTVDEQNAGVIEDEVDGLPSRAMLLCVLRALEQEGRDG